MSCHRANLQTGRTRPDHRHLHWQSTIGPVSKCAVAVALLTPVDEVHSTSQTPCDERFGPAKPVKMAVIADLVDISQRSGVGLPFDEVVDVSEIKRVKATTNLSQAEQQANSKQQRERERERERERGSQRA